MTETRIGVLLLNWENCQHTLNCLESLAAGAPRAARVVVVDNASRDDSVAQMESWARSRRVGSAVLKAGDASNAGSEWLTIIVAPENRGFAIGNNHGLRFLRDNTDVTHVLLLNNDARAASDAIGELASAIAVRPNAGLVTGTIFVDRGGDDRSQIWYAGGVDKGLRGLTAHVTEPPRSQEVQPVKFVSGCAMLISREVMQRVGLLGECYEPFYGEDAEYSRRVRSAGYPVLYAPRAIFYHKVGATIGPAHLSEKVTYSQIRHRIFYIRRNFTGAERAIALGYTVLTKPGRAIIEALKGRPRIARALLRGTVAGLLDDARG